MAIRDVQIPTREDLTSKFLGAVSRFPGEQDLEEIKVIITTSGKVRPLGGELQGGEQEIFLSTSRSGSDSETLSPESRLSEIYGSERLKRLSLTQFDNELFQRGLYCNVNEIKQLSSQAFADLAHLTNTELTNNYGIDLVLPNACHGRALGIHMNIYPEGDGSVQEVVEEFYDCLEALRDLNNRWSS